MRNVLARVPEANAEMVAAAIRTIFAQPDAAAVADQFDRIVAMLDGQFPDVAAMLTDAREDLLAFTPFPLEHWRKIWSTNPLERLNGEIKRRTDVVGMFPNDAAIDRLVTAVIVEPTTNGPSPNAATSPRPPWPGSARPTPPRCPPPAATRRRLAG